jgi:RHS repeat-associated protein
MLHNCTTIHKWLRLFCDLNMTSAAKIETSFPLPPTCVLTKNSRLGLSLPTAILYQGFAPVISNTTTGLRTSVYDSSRRSRITGKERDTESSLDYMDARYYGSAMGRFTSVDPEGAGASLFNPQSWSAYSYGLNNPHKYVDPDGEVPVLLVAAGIGARVGALGGALFDVGNQLILNGGDFSAINGREVGAAAPGWGCCGWNYKQAQLSA